MIASLNLFLTLKQKHTYIMSINKEAARKGVTEILHFTTNHGLLGILAQDALLPNSMLKKKIH